MALDNVLGPLPSRFTVEDPGGRGLPSASDSRDRVAISPRAVHASQS